METDHQTSVSLTDSQTALNASQLTDARQHSVMNAFPLRNSESAVWALSY